MKYHLLAGLMIISATSVLAVDSNTTMTEFIRNHAPAVTSHPVIIQAINAQNARTQNLSEAEILAMDLTWRAEIGAADTPLISSVKDITASALLVDFVGEADGIVTEVIVMDARGLNVAVSAITSDYWQGDEAKFQRTFDAGVNAVHVSDVEFDESTQEYQAQVSVTITDPTTQAVIGAVTFGLNAQSFF